MTARLRTLLFLYTLGCGPCTDQHRQARKLWVKLADIAALDADYPKAIQNYERVAKSCIGNDLMRYSVREYYLKAGVCHLAIGVSPTKSLNSVREY